MVAPILSDITPENVQLMGQLAVIAPGSLANSTPPAWLNPNYVTGADQGNVIVGVTVTFTVIAFIAVCIRLYTRATQKNRSLGLDDFTIVPAMGFAIAMEVVNVLDVYHGGAGRHSYDTTIDQFVLRWRYQFIISQLYIVTSSFVKFSIISFLRRLFNTSRKWDYFFYGLYLCYFIIFVAPFFNNLFLCHPVAAIWNLRRYAATGGHCRDLFLETLVFCIIFAISDVILLAIPLSVVTKMNVESKWKVNMICIFALGGLSCVFSIWKAAYLSAVRGSFDDSWYTTHVIILNSLETNIAIFICCVPALRTLFRRYREKSDRYTSPQHNAPDYGKTANPKGPLEKPDFDVSGSMGDEGEN